MTKSQKVKIEKPNPGHIKATTNANATAKYKKAKRNQPKANTRAQKRGGARATTVGVGGA